MNGSASAELAKAFAVLLRLLPEQCGRLETYLVSLLFSIMLSFLADKAMTI